MEERRIYLPACGEGRDLLLEGEQAHYISRVLRGREGERILLFCGDGRDYVYDITALDRQQVQVQYVTFRELQTDPVQPTVLVQGYLKSGSMDEVLRTATALGITAFVPFVAVRSIGRPAASHLERWRRVAISAAQQCGRTTIPEIRSAQPSLRSVLSEKIIEDTHNCIVCWEGGQPTGDSPFQQPSARGFGYAVVVGPEGGLTREEIDVVEAWGCSIHSLGWRILRAELAPAVALAQLNLLREQVQTGKADA